MNSARGVGQSTYTLLPYCAVRDEEEEEDEDDDDDDDDELSTWSTKLIEQVHSLNVVYNILISRPLFAREGVPFVMIYTPPPNPLFAVHSEKVVADSSPRIESVPLSPKFA